MKKNNLWLGILIGILISIIVGLIGFIVYNKVLLKNDDTNISIDENSDNNISDNQQIEEVNEISIESDLVKKLYQMTGVETTTTDFGLYNSEKLLIRNLEDSYMENLLYLQLPNDSAELVMQGSQNYLKWDGSTIKALWAKMFGLTTEFKLSDKTINGVTYQSDGTLILPYESGRFEGMDVYTSELLKATQSSTEIILYEAVKFIDYEFTTDYNIFRYYSDYEKTIPTTKDAKISANYKKVFKKDIDGNYYFYSIERIY